MGDETIDIEVQEIQPMIKRFYYDRKSIRDSKNNILQCILNNDEENHIKNMVNYYQEDLEINPDEGLRKYRYKEHNNKTILIIACINDIVDTKTLDTLCLAMKLKYGDIDYIDEMWFGWEPIHYVARSANLEKLKVILKYTSDQFINSLTYFSENALHILLQYEKSVTPFTVVLNNNVESRAIHIIGIEKPNVIDCAKLLIEKGVDVNHTNFWNETAICLAIRYKYTQLIELLLTVDYIDLDSFIESGKTIRDNLKWDLYASLPQSYIQEDPAKIRFNFLKSGDEDSFLRFNYETFSDTVNTFDYGDESNSCGTMLQFCMRKGYFEFVQSETSRTRKFTMYDIKDNPMLTIFSSKGFSRSIIHLLNNGADPSITSRKFTTTLLEYSAVRGYYPFVALILQHKNSKIHCEDIFAVLPKLFQTKITFTNRGFYRNSVLYLLMNKLLYLFRLNKDKEKLTSKRLAILNKLLHNLNLEANEKKVDDSEIICQILSLGGSLTAKGIDSSINPYDNSKNNSQNNANKEENRKMVVERIDPNILRSHFNDCINGTRFQYDSIIQDDNEIYNENRTLRFLANDKYKQDLLCHPLMIEFVRRKWYKVRWFFYADLVFYAFLMISIYVYMIYSHFKCFYFYLNIIYYFLLGFHIVKESLQLFFLYRWKYFTENSNNLELATIASCIITNIYPNIYTSVTAILLSTLIFFLILGQLPYFTKYTIIFSSIKYFFQYTGFYFIQFISFALCFYIVFPFENFENPDHKRQANESSLTAGPEWGDIFKSLFYTLIYFTGEFSDRVLEPTDFPIFGRFVMTLFIFCMTIILNNLLVGLIVADMDDMQKSGRLYKQIKLASFIQSTNTLIKRLKKFKNINFIKHIIYRITIFQKGHQKVLKNVDVNHFDDENRQYLRDIKKTPAYDKFLLRTVYRLIIK